MKYLLALFIVSLTLQPFELQACAMDTDQQSAHHAAMHDGAEAECCSPAAPEPMRDCGGAAHCAFVSLGFLAVPPTEDTLLPLPGRHYDLVDDPRYNGPPAPPLFRPPIA